MLINQIKNVNKSINQIQNCNYSKIQKYRGKKTSPSPRFARLGNNSGTFYLVFQSQAVIRYSSRCPGTVRASAAQKPMHCHALCYRCPFRHGCSSVLVLSRPTRSCLTVPVQPQPFIFAGRLAGLPTVPFNLIAVWAHIAEYPSTTGNRSHAVPVLVHTASTPGQRHSEPTHGQSGFTVPQPVTPGNLTTARTGHFTANAVLVPRGRPAPASASLPNVRPSKRCVRFAPCALRARSFNWISIEFLTNHYSYSLRDEVND